MSTTRIARELCSNPAFIEWLGVEDEADAARFVRTECGIHCLADLDRMPFAALAFHDNVQVPFLNRSLGEE